MRLRVLSGMELQPRIDIRTNEPAPNRALMIGRIARAQVAIIIGFCIQDRKD